MNRMRPSKRNFQLGAMIEGSPLAASKNDPDVTGIRPARKEKSQREAKAVAPGDHDRDVTCRRGIESRLSFNRHGRRRPTIHEFVGRRSDWLPPIQEKMHHG